MVGRWFFMVIGTIFSIMPAFVYWLAGTMAANGSPDAPTAGDIVAFTTLQSRLFFPLGQLLNVQVEIQGSLALFDRIFEYLDLDPEIIDAPDAVGARAATRSGAPSRSRACRSTTSPSPAPPAPTVGDVAAAVDLEASPGLAEAVFDDADAFEDAAEPEAVDAEAVATEAEPPPAFGLEDLTFEAQPGELVALVGPVGRRQDDDDLPDPAPVRRDRRAGSRSTASTSARSSSSRWAG